MAINDVRSVITSVPQTTPEQQAATAEEAKFQPLTLTQRIERNRQQQQQQRRQNTLNHFSKKKDGERDILQQFVLPPVVTVPPHPEPLYRTTQESLQKTLDTE